MNTYSRPVLADAAVLVDEPSYFGVRFLSSYWTDDESDGTGKMAKAMEGLCILWRGGERKHGL